MPDYPVFDFFPGGARFVVDDRDRDVLEGALAESDAVGDAFNALFDHQVRRLEADPEYRHALREIYRAAGVNLVSPTMWSFGNQERAESHREDRTTVLGRWQARFDTVVWLRKITDPKTARETVAADGVGAVLNTQNLGKDIQGDPDRIDTLYDYGVRIAQLTYNSQNDLGTGCMERGDAGLSRLGETVVEQLNERGMVVDCSHCGEATSRDAIETSADPVAFTHTFCRAVADHPRGKSDDLLETLAANDGYAGILTIPFFISPDDFGAAFDRFFDHIDHAVSILGVDNVGIGTDWGAWSLAARDDLPAGVREGVRQTYGDIGFPEGMEHIGQSFGPMDRFTDWNAIPDGLRERGYSDASIRKLTGENFLRFWERVRAD